MSSLISDMGRARRLVPLLAAVSLSAGVIILVVGALWMAGSASGERAMFSSLEIAPREADVFVAINTDPTSPQWLSAVDSLETLNAKDPIREAIDKELLQFGLEFERDILPLAGDEGYLAVTDMESAADDTWGPVVAFRVRDPDEAEQIVLDIAAHEGTEFTEDEYEGVIIRTSADADSAGSVAFVADVMVFGISDEDVKAVIDVVQGRAPSAEQNERLQELRQAQGEDFLIWGAADLAPIWDMAESSIPADSGTIGGSDGSETADPPVDTTESGEAPPPQDGFRIPAFDADYRIENGALHVTERITVDFGETPNHGINRDVATRITYDFINDVIVTIEPLSVTKEGSPEPFEHTPAVGDYHQIRIGDPNVTLTGLHTYEIQYIATGALVNVESEDGNASYDVVWNATGDNWGVPIERGSATLTIPDGNFLYTPCSVGEDPFPGLQLGCSMTQDGITTIRFASESPIEPGSGMAFMASVSGVSGAPEPVLVPNQRLPFEYGEPGDEFPFPFDSAEIFNELRGTYDRVGFSISSTGDGFTFDLSVLHAPGFEPKYALEPTEVFDSQFAESVPASTMFFFAGYDFYGQSWLPLRNQLEDVKFTDGTTLDDFLQNFADETGLDLEGDILSLMTGEYAIAGDVSDFNQGTPEFSILAMLDVADADRAQRSLDKLGDYLEGDGKVDIDKGGGVQQWTIEGSAAEVVGVTVNGDAVIAGYPHSKVEDAVAGFDQSLSGTSDWKRTMGLLADETTSIGFISVSRILEEARKMDGADSSLEEATDGELTLEDLTPVRSVGYATTAIEGGYGARFVVLITD